MRGKLRSTKRGLLGLGHVAGALSSWAWDRAALSLPLALDNGEEVESAAQGGALENENILCGRVKLRCRARKHVLLRVKGSGSLLRVTPTLEATQCPSAEGRRVNKA